MIKDTLAQLTQPKDLWSDSKLIYQKILKLPFIQELIQGTLPPQKFSFYLQQDALYLIDFARALALVAAKANNASDIIAFIKYAEGAIIDERELHQYYFNHYSIYESSHKNDACFAYTHYLISTTATQSLEVSVATVLPCFWIYRDVGKYILKNAPKNNPYSKWIETYASENFSNLVDEALSIAERLYENTSTSIQTTMEKAAQQSSTLEWRFWNEAYNSSLD